MVDWAREVCQASKEAMGNTVRFHSKMGDLILMLRVKRIWADLG